MITCNIKGHNLKFITNEKCFSPNNIDKGTLAMLSLVEFNENDKVIDLGCGYGVVGIVAAKFTNPSNVYMLDINKESLYYAKENAILNDVPGINIIESDAYSNLNESGFDIILSNPPYHTDFSVAKKFIEKGFNRLKVGGKIFIVTKRLAWYQNKLKSIFGGVRVNEVDGYYVFFSEKRKNLYDNI